MKVKYKEVVGKFTVIRFIADAPVDVEATKKAVLAAITPSTARDAVRRLYEKNAVFARVGPEADLIGDGLASRIQQKLDDRGPNQQLLDSCEYIADYRGAGYWIKKSDNWKNEKIEEMGIALPMDAVLEADLTEDQQKEISAQKERERIAGLPVEKKAEEKNIRLRALAREALLKAEEAELLGGIFDKKAWLAPKKAEIEAMHI